MSLFAGRLDHSRGVIGSGERHQEVYLEERQETEQEMDVSVSVLSDTLSLIRSFALEVDQS